MSARVSGVVTTLNNAATLDDCLASLSFCDELVVLDSGSHDATLQIAGRTALLLKSAGEHTLAEKLRDGRLSLDLLRRFGEEGEGQQGTAERTDDHHAIR